MLMPKLKAPISFTKIIMILVWPLAHHKAWLYPLYVMRIKLTLPQLKKIFGELGKRARDGKLSMADLSGGTFTITNGGIYGSLMSTPILNPPQSGILGMHSIKERAVVINGKVEARPMMYLALSYDHRIIDGREAVTFLVRVKECIENPERLLLGV